jgi:type I restriction enzyme, R subunit
MTGQPNTRRQRVGRVKRQQTAFFNYLGPEARQIVDDLLEEYAADSDLDFNLPDVPKLPPISQDGNANEFIRSIGAAGPLRNRVNQLQILLYPACREPQRRKICQRLTTFLR